MKTQIIPMEIVIDKITGKVNFVTFFVPRFFSNFNFQICIKFKRINKAEYKIYHQNTYLVYMRYVKF